MLSSRVLLGTLALAAAISLTACGNKDATNNYNSKSYGHDGYMGLSNSNPHLPNRNGEFLNQDTDGDFAQSKLKQIPGVDKASIVFRAPDMFVTVTPRKGFDSARVKAEALTVLQFNMPRYNVHVNMAR
ncbi:hypothetical protein [Paenibacillus sacheonensis]|uniref:Sporulation protein n=1 Tax=Paenibacillus sacheonensis TaxID=742054 RepID=A0A7X4YRK4_9BACL|nr:hypothetical protein [Paenibacillus sacheonensis]MBM7567664.1 hypothetical protein [Paenibacillus sacheonensis]NBC71233.1 hypothetical protein [Paenibacillus sacheonensis]